MSWQSKTSPRPLIGQDTSRRTHVESRKHTRNGNFTLNPLLKRHKYFDTTGGALPRWQSDNSIPPGIKSDLDSEEDIIDNFLNDDPVTEYERLTFDMEPDVPVINNVDELNKDECFDPGGGEINVEVDDSFTFVIRTFLPYLTYPEVSPLLSSTENEDTIFDPGIST
ncbi:hypothetical protein Tco_0770409 [Tanacetum coccineum]|uniref:Uncharacterized protein n=1 Tax=Tanacetum coccineum TaxID=301880 RepID=A0ABQ4ZG21_9ASTR